MTFRARVLIAGVALALVPLVILAVGVRRETRARLAGQYERQARAAVTRARATLAAESDAVAGRLSRLAAALADDNRVRLTMQGDSAGRAYLLDYAGRAMRLAGLDVLFIQDARGRILSSGHFRNEFDRVDSLTPAALVAAGSPALLHVRTPSAALVVLARLDTARVGGRVYTLIGGRAIDDPFVARLAPDSVVAITLLVPGLDSVRDSSERVVIEETSVPFVAADGTAGAARLVAAASFAPLRALVRGLDRWFLAALVVTALGAVLLAVWLATRVSRPLTELAGQTARVDLDRLDVDFATERRDEIGDLSRLLQAMTRRLQGSAARLREAERRLAVGELARQVNHDVKNGLIPVRNVMRHLAEVARDDPAHLPEVFKERERTLESGLAYLESLAASYARLTPQFQGNACDANAVVRDVAAGVTGREGLTIRTTLEDGLPAVRGDAVMLRRIVENLVENALDSLGTAAGTVEVSTALVNGTQHAVALTVMDTGPGMTRAQLDRAFEDFFTTKPRGTGLGLSIVRRLVLDLEGSLRVETEPGKGTAFRVELPASRPEDAA